MLRALSSGTKTNLPPSHVGCHARYASIDAKPFGNVREDEGRHPPPSHELAYETAAVGFPTGSSVHILAQVDPAAADASNR